MRFTETHDRAVAVAFEDVADCLIEYGLFGVVYILRFARLLPLRSVF
jgi:hypothetical protein